MWKFLATTLLALGLWTSAAGVHAQTCGLRDNGDGTMTDLGTGLQIRKCAEGQRWAGGGCSGSEQPYTWDEAVQRFGQGEWRLIAKAEAEQVTKRSKNCPINNPSWISTRNAGNRYDAWNVDFSRGEVYNTFTNGPKYPVRLVRGGSSRSLDESSQAYSRNNSSNSQSAQTQTQNQQATAPVPPAAYKKPTRDRPDLMGHGCDVGQGLTVKNGCSEIINYVLCIVRHPDGRTTGPDTCLGGQIRPGILLPQDSRRVTSGEGSTDYLVAACKFPARPYNVQYIPGQGLSVSCGEF